MLVKVKNLDRFVEGFKSKKYTLENAAKSLFKDKQSILKILPYDATGALFNHLPKKLQNDEPFIKQLTGLNGKLFLKATKYHNNNDLALLAIKTCPDVAEFLNFDEENGLELAVKAVENNAFAQRHLKQYAEHEKVLMTALPQQGILYRYLSSQSQKNEEYATVALKSSPFVYRFLPKELKESVELATIAIETNKGYAYSIYKEQVSDSVRANPQVAVLAITKNLLSMLSVPSVTFQSEEFLVTFKEYLDVSRQNFIENGDEEGLENFEKNVNAVFTQKSQMVLQESITNLLNRKQQLQENFNENLNESVGLDEFLQQVDGVDGKTFETTKETVTLDKTQQNGFKTIQKEVEEAQNFNLTQKQSAIFLDGYQD